MRVVNVTKEKCTVRAHRPHLLGNPFVMRDESERELVCKQYAAQLRFNPSKAWDKIREAIKALPEDAVLGCFCAPKACHCDEIVAFKEGKTSPAMGL